MTILKHALTFDELDDKNQYWTNGKSVYHHNRQVKGADIDSFEHFFGIWAKDCKSCYSGSLKFRNADTETFIALNYTYAKDKENVWTLAGNIKEADPITFTVCDSGKHSLGKSVRNVGQNKMLHEQYVPYGFGKDRNNVYYYDFQGKSKIVRKANPTTFVSLDDGYFGYDDKYVYCGFTTIPNADPETWKKLKENYYYSLYGNRIF